MPNQSATKVSFYIIAHADDGQLFMQPNIYNDLTAPDSKAVFVITTAGDAGMGKTYWQAREEGLKGSIRFCMAPLLSLSESNGKKEFNNHIVHYWSVNNVTAYFLRLPDGGLDGKGFTKNQYQSLSQLQAGRINKITAIDGSTTYHSQADFCTMLQTIILYECTDATTVWINYLNPDITANPQDHPDHIATGQAIQDIPVITRFWQALYVGYNSRQIAEKLSPEDLFWKAGMFAAYEKAVYDATGYSTLHENIVTYMAWSISKAAFIILNPQA